MDETKPVETVLSEVDKQRLSHARSLVGILRNVELSENLIVHPTRIYQEVRALEELRRAFDFAREALTVFLGDFGDPDQYDIPF